MEPASSIITKLGGPTAVARIANVHRTRVSNWKRPAVAGGTGGHIPAKHIPALLDYAASNGVAISAADFFPAHAGAPAPAPAREKGAA